MHDAEQLFLIRNNFVPNEKKGILILIENLNFGSFFFLDFCCKIV